MDITQQLEALLFWKGEAISVADLTKILKTTADEVANAIRNLQHQYENRGIAIMFEKDQVSLVTAPGASDLIEALTREELSRDLGKAGLETLAVIVYKGPISRTDVDYIRGVNSSFIIRHLLIRGLIERAPSSSDSRIFLYQPTTDLTRYLGLNSLEELPEYNSLRQTIDQLVENSSANVEQK